jgi:hypothetical protein
MKKYPVHKIIVVAYAGDDEKSLKPTSALITTTTHLKSEGCSVRSAIDISLDDTVIQQYLKELLATLEDPSRVSTPIK